MINWTWVRTFLTVMILTMVVSAETTVDAKISKAIMVDYECSQMTCSFFSPQITSWENYESIQWRIGKFLYPVLSVTHVFQEPGEYEIDLVTIDRDGIYTQMILTITVEKKQKVH